VAESDQSTLKDIEAALKFEGLDVVASTSAVKAATLIKKRRFDLVIANTRMAEVTGTELIRLVKIHQPATEVVLLADKGTVKTAVRAMASGAYYFLKKPFCPREVNLISKRAIALRQNRTGSESEDNNKTYDYFFDNIIGTSTEMKMVFDLIRKAGPSSVPILIQGESGTGKELVARAIHRHSPRDSKSFLAINTAALSDTLLESELFGYRKGAFTGAVRNKVGLLEAASSGTLLLDEISSMSKSMQSKLLRVIEESEIIRVGDSRTIKVDVRFISASNRSLKEMVERGSFREDLYYRLGVIEINIPPLRERTEDIPLLVQHFLKTFSRRDNIPEKMISGGGLKVLLEHSWPGNVRELENVIKRAVVTSEARIIRAKNIVIKKYTHPRAGTYSQLYDMKYETALRTLRDKFQKEYLRNHFKAARGNISQMARRTGVSRQSLYALMRKHKFKKAARKRSVIKT